MVFTFMFAEENEDTGGQPQGRAAFLPRSAASFLTAEVGFFGFISLEAN